jgi:hypothetical protein
MKNHSYCTKQALDAWPGDGVALMAMHTLGRHQEANSYASDR